MKYNPITPEYMLPDDKNYFAKKGTNIRKGTMAAALTNAEIVEAQDATESEKQKALDGIKELASTLKAMGLTKFMTWKNPRIQALFDELKDE